jgi:hypothetical protein
MNLILTPESVYQDSGLVEKFLTVAPLTND